MCYICTASPIWEKTEINRAQDLDLSGTFSKAAGMSDLSFLLALWSCGWVSV